MKYFSQTYNFVSFAVFPNLWCIMLLKPIEGKWGKRFEDGKNDDRGAPVCFTHAGAAFRCHFLCALRGPGADGVSLAAPEGRRGGRPGSRFFCERVPSGKPLGLLSGPDSFSGCFF